MLRAFPKVYTVGIVLFAGYFWTIDRGDDCQINTPSLNSRVVALVLARGGSKGIPLKNIANIGNDTLLGRTLKRLAEFGRFDEIWVSTDNEPIRREAKAHGVLVHARDPSSATDEATSLDGIKDFLAGHRGFGFLALVQCTSPFLKVAHLENAFKMVKEGYDSVFTVSRQHKLRWKRHRGKWESDNFNVKRRPRRQDWPGEMVENGMFYVFNKDLPINCNTIQGGRIGVVEVASNESMEIDTPLDLLLANTIVREHEKQMG